MEVGHLHLIMQGNGDLIVKYGVKMQENGA